MATLVTGSTGFLAHHLLPLLQGEIYCLYRNKPPKWGIPLKGDILQPNLGLNNPPKFDAVYHLAADTNLTGKETYRTNVDGTYNVLSFMYDQGIKRLYYVSTAYLEGRNIYEISKRRAENLVHIFRKVHGFKVTIFRPSIMVGHSQTGEAFGAKTFYEIVRWIILVHRRAEALRRAIERGLKLPPLEPVFRIRGNPKATLNLVPVDKVAEAIANIKDTGVYYLTNAYPPTLEELAKWVGQVIFLNIRFERNFKPSTIERVFELAASPYLGYLQGERKFPTSVDGLTVDEEFIKKTTTWLVMKGLG